MPNLKKLRLGVAGDGGNDVGAQAWHALSVDEALARLESDQGGLTDEEVSQRLSEYGPNRLPEAPPPTLFQIALRHTYLR